MVPRCSPGLGACGACRADPTRGRIRRGQRRCCSRMFWRVGAGSGTSKAVRGPRRLGTLNRTISESSAGGGTKLRPKPGPQRPRRSEAPSNRSSADPPDRCPLGAQWSCPPQILSKADKPLACGLLEGEALWAVLAARVCVCTSGGPVNCGRSIEGLLKGVAKMSLTFRGSLGSVKIWPRSASQTRVRDANGHERFPRNHLPVAGQNPQR